MRFKMAHGTVIAEAVTSPFSPESVMPKKYRLHLGSTDASPFEFDGDQPIYIYNETGKLEKFITPAQEIALENLMVLGGRIDALKHSLDERDRVNADLRAERDAAYAKGLKDGEFNTARRNRSSGTYMAALAVMGAQPGDIVRSIREFGDRKYGEGRNDMVIFRDALAEVRTALGTAEGSDVVEHATACAACLRAAAEVCADASIFVSNRAGGIREALRVLGEEYAREKAANLQFYQQNRGYQANASTLGVRALTVETTRGETLRLEAPNVPTLRT